ncbi:alpha/beta hydrolase [Rhodococcus sp. HM1]|uniref:alpha/beta hydrolase n=1 Tax=Rhodococcus sp. HM1 TaxID=2937759 RepID=UPI00200B5CDE|nr:alpha/beta hydrolase [Rhodococcus sp. HM1]MCK8671936.1 alpha/beta hydrolase [Rhodococcus sp. HM1]
MGVQYPTWFGPDDLPLLGTVHVPDSGRARAAVVLCPPLGKEHVDTYRGIKALAESLADRGLLAVRFDYAGAGDSAGAQDDPDAVTGWLRSVVEAVGSARATGASSICLVGLRSGALIAAAATATEAIDSMVLWDPILSGRSYLREQRAQYTLSIGADDPSDPRVSILGGVLDPAAVSALGALKIDPARLAGVRTLLAVRTAVADTPAVRSLAGALDGDEVTLVDHEAFTTPASFHVALPTGHIREIADWIAAGAPAADTEVRLKVRDRAQVASAPDGRPVVETLEELGPNGLFAIRTHATGGDGSTHPTLLFHATAYEHRVGPGRLWVEIARSLAADGVSSVRYDRRGTGNTGVVDPDHPVALYSDDSDRDARDAAGAAVADPRDLVMTGLCSGAWYSAAVALRVRPRAVILTDLILWSVYRRRSLREQLAPGMPAGDGAGGDASARARIKALLQRHLPYPAWRLLGRFGVTQVPEVLLEALRKAGVPTTVILSAEDHAWFVGQRGEEGLRRLRRRGGDPEIHAVGFGDHPALHRDLRERIRTVTTETVLRRFGIPVDTERTADTGRTAEALR